MHITYICINVYTDIVYINYNKLYRVSTALLLLKPHLINDVSLFIRLDATDDFVRT